MMRTRSTQWDGDPWEQSEKHDTEKEKMKKNVQSTRDLKVCANIIPDLFRSCRNCDLVEQFMVLYHVKEIMKQDWRFCDMKVYAHSKQICIILANSCNYFFFSSMVLQIYKGRPPTLSFCLSFILNIFFQT